MKNEIRKTKKAVRLAMSTAEVTEKSRSAARVFLQSLIYKNADRIMVYMPLGNEVDTEDIVKAAFGEGKILAFPVTDADSGEITPYYAAEDSEFISGAFSVMEPCGTEPADVSEIDVVIVPGVAFDKRGARIGFGKGCYDRLLEKADAVKVGLCYEFQVCDEIPAEGHDVCMDFLITERGLIDCCRFE